MEEDFYSAVLYECLVLDTSRNSGYPMESLLVTSLTPPRTGATPPGRGMVPVWTSPAAVVQLCCACSLEWPPGTLYGSRGR